MQVWGNSTLGTFEKKQKTEFNLKKNVSCNMKMFGHDSFLEGQTALFSNAKNIFYSGFYAAFSACACSLCPLGCFSPWKCG